MFKRRMKRSWLRLVADSVYPRGGWARAASYIAHRLQRLPDTPAKIARGIAAGVFVSFTPFFGFHFLMAAIVNLVVRGNLLAALLATFVGNPLTFPLIATLCLEIGNLLLGRSEIFPFRRIADSFATASVELWRNVKAFFGYGHAEWSQLSEFFDTVFLPYLVGGMLPGLAAGIVAYLLSRPVIAAYQKRRRRKLREKWLALQDRQAASRSESVPPPDHRDSASEL